MRLVLGGTFVGVFAGALSLVSGLPDVSILKNAYPRVVHRADAGEASPEPRIDFSHRRPAAWVGIDEIAPIAVAAIVISEDGHFYQHNGVDWGQLREALKESLLAFELTRGASTITQQVAKNVFLSREKTLMRKAREFILAQELEKAFPKKKILETYLNIIELGPATYGIRAGASRYFGKYPSELSAKEGAFLAMLLPNPVRYDESYEQRGLTPYACRIVRSLLQKLVVTGRLTPEEMQAEWERPLSFEDGFTCDSDDG